MPSTDETFTDWTEKHRPRTLDEVVGNSKAVKELLAWAREWQSGTPEKERAVILAGEPGVGKTTAAHALAHDLGWGVVELNASDARNADAIRRVASSGAVNRAFNLEGDADDPMDSGRQLIILDEADNLHGTSDRGGMRTITQTIRETKQPIVLIANDYYQLTRKGSSLRSIAKTIKFTRVHTRSIPPALRRIAEEEGLSLEDGVAESIASRSGGDLRSAVNDLQSLSVDRDALTLADVETLGYRDVTGDVWGLMGKIFYGTSLDEARQRARELDETPDHIALWVDENLPTMYRNKADLVDGFDRLARADQYLGRVGRRQHYGLWAYASTLMTGGVATAKTERPPGARFGFPRWLSKMSQSRAKREVRNGIARAVGDATHTSTTVARSDMLPFLREMMQRDEAFAEWATWYLHLDADQLAFLLETKSTTKRVKKLLAAAEARHEREAPQAAAAPAGGLGAYATPDAVERDAEESGDATVEDVDATEAATEEAEETKDATKNKSLFDF